MIMIDEEVYEEEAPEVKPRKATRHVPKARLTFYGVTFWIGDDDDPDDVIERYVAAGRHKTLEKIDPETAVMLTQRFIRHQEFLDSKKTGKKFVFGGKDA